MAEVIKRRNSKRVRQLEEYAKDKLDLDLSQDELDMVESDDGTPIMGSVARATADPEDRVRQGKTVGWRDSMTPGEAFVGEEAGDQPRVFRRGNPERQAPIVETEAPRVYRGRTPAERLDEMTRLLFDQFGKTGRLPESIIRDIQGEYALNGQIVSVEDLKAIAAIYLRRAERETHR